MNRAQKKLSQRQIRRQQKNRARVCVLAVLALSIAAIGLMALLNRLPSGSRYTYTTAEDIWYLENAEMQIAAPEAGESN